MLGSAGFVMDDARGIIPECGGKTGMVGAGGLVGGEARREEGKKRWLTPGSAAGESGG